MPTTLYIIRHGETEDNARRIFQGQTPGKLSQKGEEQAAALQAKLKAIYFDVVLCSDLKRCVDTAKIALKEKDVPIITTPLLRERNMGNLTGLSMINATLNKSVESNEAVGTRAGAFLQLINKEYAGKNILVFSHGFFLKMLQSIIEGKPQYEIPVMGNCEIRTFEIE